MMNPGKAAALLGFSLIFASPPPPRPRGTVTKLAKPSSNRKAQLLEKALRRKARQG